MFTRLFMGQVLLAVGLALVTAGWAQPTPPIMPKLQEVPLPPPLELPPPPTLPAEVPNRPLTADEAAAIALLAQPAVAAARAGVEAAAGRVQQVQSGLGNQGVLAAGLNASAAVSVPAAGVPSEFQFSATVRRLLYDFNHTRDLVRQAQAQSDLAAAGLTTVQANLVLQVKQSFYALVQSTRLVEVAENNARNQERHAMLAQARLSSGLGLPYDVVRAQTALSEAVYDVTVARNQAALARVGLAELMGIDPRTPLIAAEGNESATASEDVTALVEQALQQRPEMAQAQAAIAAAQYAIAAAHTVNSPVVSGSVGYTQRGNLIFPDSGVATLGVGVQWNAYDAGFTKALVRQTEANLRAAEAQRQAVRLAVTADVSQAYLNLKTAEQRLLTAAAQIENATEALRLAEGRYRAGLGIFLDVLDAQTALDTAGINLVNAESALDQARAAMRHATGDNLPPPPTPAG